MDSVNKDKPLGRNKGRRSISLSGSSVVFLEGFADRHHDITDSYAGIVGWGLMIVKLSEDLPPNKVLAVVDTETGVSKPIVLPWRQDADRTLLPPL